MHGNGFVNWPNGQALLSYNAEKDSGTQYDHKGKIVRTWSCASSTSVGDSVEVLLDQNLAFRHRMPEGVAEVYVSLSLAHTHTSTHTHTLCDIKARPGTLI